MMKTLHRFLSNQVSQPVRLVITALLIGGIIHGIHQISELAAAHWNEPNIYGDSFTFVLRGGNKSLLAWLFHQHNEHRIVWAKAASLIESALFKLPPGQTALFQNLALILGCAGLWSWLCQRMLHRNVLRLITALAGSLLLLNPWQYENLGWEFQTPWFLINALVLLGALVLSIPTAGRFPQSVVSALLPWVALTSTGQGLALAVGFAGCSWLHSRKLGALVSASTALAGLSFYLLLPYNKPAGHPEISFQIDYFLRAWLGGPWQGLALLCVVIAAVLLGRRHPIPRASWPALLLPGLFSLLFAGMITLSRAGFGVEQANSSRYITHSLMLGLTALMALALSDDHSRRPTTPLLGGFLVLLTTIGSFPQGLQSGALSYTGAWNEGRRWAEQKRKRFICHAEQAELAANNIRLLDPCNEIFPNQQVIDQYFQSGWPVEPLGWHRELLINHQISASSPIRYHVDHQTLSSSSVQLQGWAFMKTPNRPQLYLIADYGNQGRVAVPVDQPRRDVKRTLGLSTARVGFNATFPHSQNGQVLRAVRIGTPNQSVQIWEDPSADG